MRRAMETCERQSRRSPMNHFGVIIAAVVGAIAVMGAPPIASAQRPARAPSDSVSAPIRDVHYELTFMRANAQQRVVDVTMTFATTSAAPVLLSLPAWTPGAY